MIVTLRAGERDDSGHDCAMSDSESRAPRFGVRPRIACCNRVEKMAGSTGLEPATSGLTVSIRAPSRAVICRNHAATLPCRVGACRPFSPLVPGESSGERPA
jgi:hypothetical protein